MSRWKYIKTVKLSDLSLQRIKKVIMNRLKYIPHSLAWKLNTAPAKQSKLNLDKYRDLHKGKRCFIVANGPSLKVTDLSRLDGEFTFGMNRIYLSGFEPTYLVVTDIETMLKQFTDEFRERKGPKFYNWRTRNWFKNVPDLTFINLDYNARFSTNLNESGWGGHSVTFLCLQLAYHMGFSEVILIGKDHSYKGQGVPGQFVAATDKEENHFIKDYIPKGKGWKIPDYKGEELAYELAREAFEKDRRKVYDATIGGMLDIFEKKDYNSLFTKEQPA
ncbi:6-hydroxymethylpterin diphosphokinase MptE-like protein [Mucilaginibacter defluvii]